MHIDTREGTLAKYDYLIGKTQELNNVWLAVEGFGLAPTKRGWLFKASWFMECRDKKTKPVRHEYAVEVDGLVDCPSPEEIQKMLTRSLDRFTCRKWMRDPSL